MPLKSIWNKKKLKSKNVFFNMEEKLKHLKLFSKLFWKKKTNIALSHARLCYQSQVSCCVSEQLILLQEEGTSFKLG